MLTFSLFIMGVIKKIFKWFGIGVLIFFTLQFLWALGYFPINPWKTMEKLIHMAEFKYEELTNPQDLLILEGKYKILPANDIVYKEIEKRKDPSVVNKGYLYQPVKKEGNICVYEIYDPDVTDWKAYLYFPCNFKVMLRKYFFTNDIDYLYFIYYKTSTYDEGFVILGIEEDDGVCGIDLNKRIPQFMRVKYYDRIRYVDKSGDEFLSRFKEELYSAFPGGLRIGADIYLEEYNKAPCLKISSDKTPEGRAMFRYILKNLDIVKVGK